MFSFRGGEVPFRFRRKRLVVAKFSCSIERFTRHSSRMTHEVM